MDLKERKKKMDITTILIGFIMITTGVAAASISKVRISTAPSDFDKLRAYATIGVKAAEQLWKHYSGSDAGKLKKQEVMKWLQLKNLRVDAGDIDMAIESAVLELKKELS